MQKRLLLWLLVLPSLMVGCAQKPSQPEASPSPPTTETAPVDHVRQKANDIQKKAMEREQMTPESQAQPSPSPSN